MKVPDFDAKWRGELEKKNLLTPNVLEVQIKMLVKESMLIGSTFFFLSSGIYYLHLSSNYVGLYKKLSASLLDFMILSFK
jgi:hypothetical protein